VSVCACVRACVLACMRVCGSPSLVFLDGADYWSLFIYLEGADRRFFFAHIHAWSVKRGQIWENLKIVIIYDDLKVLPNLSTPYAPGVDRMRIICLFSCICFHIYLL